MLRVTGIGHIGIFVQDLERMVAFYRDFLGMQITKQNRAAGIVFLSANPEASDHEIILARGRTNASDPHLIHHISLRVPNLNDVREFRRRLINDGYRIDMVLNHGSAIGCYFFDPEGNRLEVFWCTNRPCWVVIGNPIDIEQSDAAVLAEVDRLHQTVKEVPVGGNFGDESLTVPTG